MNIDFPKLNFKKVRLPDDFGAVYQREVASKADNKAKVFLTGAFITVIIFLIFGIRPLSITTAQNGKVLRELKTIEKGLEVKLAKIDDGTIKIENLKSKIKLLNKRVAPDILLEDYLEEFVLGAAKSGFVVQRFRQVDSPGDAIPLEIELVGNIKSLPKLIQTIENSTRFTEITNIRTGLEDIFTNVRIGVVIHTL
ncbi:hypothetical protein HN803_06255 [candidate division WWE3 bacterium]|jgi:hypothetical protein|nr:hypothetical protein [candidate division WWE3 bacterium]MBT7350358.1 hypothetical protein [candidate division WWE3 bacterium]